MIYRLIKVEVISLSLEIIVEFLDHYNLPWVILAVLSWLSIYFSCSFHCFLQALPVGIWIMAVGTVLEQFFIYHRFWEDHFIMVPIGESDLFLIIGPFFSIGILLIRFLPKNRWGQFFTVLILSGLAAGIELIAVKLGFLTYNSAKWGFLNSFIAYYLGLMSALGFYYVYYSKNISFRNHR